MADWCVIIYLNLYHYWTVTVTVWPEHVGTEAKNRKVYEWVTKIKMMLQKCWWFPSLNAIALACWGPLRSGGVGCLCVWVCSSEPHHHWQRDSPYTPLVLWQAASASMQPLSLACARARLKQERVRWSTWLGAEINKWLSFQWHRWYLAPCEVFVFWGIHN